MITLEMDLGTTALKLTLVGEDDEIIASASRALSVQRSAPGHSQQHPDAWWAAACEGLDELRAKAPRALAEVVSIGLSGQMHGATLLDSAGQVLRPCILWNDGRSQAECAEFEAAWPASRQVSGNLAMPGFTAPKLLWVRRHEPEIFTRVAKVLLPKAWLAWKLTGQYVEEMSDASGTLWLDVAQRRWSADALQATGPHEAQMPRLVEGSVPAAALSAECTARWGFKRAPLLAGGAGDCAAHWVQVLADVLGIPLHQVAESEHGSALGVARLARMAAGAGLEVARAPRRLRSFEPRTDAMRRHNEQHVRWQLMARHAHDFI